MIQIKFIESFICLRNISEFFLKMRPISYRSPIYANMIARRTLGVGVGLLLISFFATSNAGMLSEIPQKLNKINIEYCLRW